MSHLDNLSLRELRQLAYAKMRLPIVEEQERQACRGGLIHFIRHFWKVLEPRTKLVEGWPLEAICEHLEAVTYGEITRLLINVPPGFMKAIDCNTPVLTTWGWKRHGDLRPGDFVFGPDGKPKRVLANTAPGDEESYEVEFDDGAVIVAGKGHLWEVERDFPYGGPQSTRCRKTEVVTTANLVPSVVGRAVQRPDRIPVVHAIEMAPRRLLIDPYLLGVWLGDGGTDSASLHVGHEDIEHFKLLGAIGSVYPPNGTRKQAFYRLTVDGLQTKLRVMGLLGNKHIPDDYLQSCIDQRWELLRGLMDTDGCATKTGHCTFVTKLKHLGAQVLTLACSLGIKAHLQEQWSSLNGERHGPYYQIVFTPPAGAVVFKLERKQSRLQFAQNARSRGRYVKEVRPIGAVTVNCITVEGGLYVVGEKFVTTHNSLLVDVLWPAWEWGPMNMPHLRYVTFSYSADLTMRDNGRFRDLLISPEYQRLWGKRFGLRKIGEERVTNTKTGWKFASSVGGVGTGERGDRVLLDDPHKVKEAESELVRATTVTWFQETMENRLNDIRASAIIVIMQRVHEEDVAGAILADGGYCHLMIPMRFDATRTRLATEIGWEDPRDEDGDWAWPERFPPESMAKFERRPYMWAGQYQQSPTPRGGGIIKADSWQLWPGEAYPQCELVLASLDTASTEKEQNDASALTIWGIFRDGDGSPKAILLYAWEGRLEINDLTILVGLLCSVEKRPDSEYYRALALFNRGDEQTDALYRVPVDRLLVENKNNGISVAHELIRLFGHSGNFAVELIDPKQFGDKVARIIACEPMFADEMVYAPDRAFAERVIENVSAVPKTSRWDTPDSVSQALLYMRKTGLLLRKDEQARVTHEQLLFKPNPPPLY